MMRKSFVNPEARRGANRGSIRVPGHRSSYIETRTTTKIEDDPFKSRTNLNLKSEPDKKPEIKNEHAYLLETHSSTKNVFCSCF